MTQWAPSRRDLLKAIGATAAGCLLLPVDQAKGNQPFDHHHAAWTRLLVKHVRVLPDGNQSRVDYQGFAQDHTALSHYLATLSSVTQNEYRTWTKAEQFAFLANAYNAYTVKKILTRYPNVRSIRDLGSVFRSPWKDRFFDLLGEPQHLDGIEHDWLRADGVFDEPRVHVAVNCASIGCPMLGTHALSANTLDAQLEDWMRRFLSDRSRNRYNAKTNTLELSPIFDWYEDDFKKGRTSAFGYPGFKSVRALASRYATLLADAPSDQAAIQTQAVDIRYLDYDWSLNDVIRSFSDSHSTLAGLTASISIRRSSRHISA